MSKLMRNVLLTAKIEVTPGTDPTPTAAANSILARAGNPRPLVAEFEDRDNIQPYFGNAGKVLTAQYSQCDFEVECASAGAAGTAPKFGPLLRACGFDEEIVVDTSVAYTPITTGQESITMYWYLDGLLHKMTYCKGNVSLGLNSRSIPVLRFTFTGLHSTPTDVSMPTDEDYTGFMAPLAINKVNTPTFTLHGVSPKCQSLDIDLANQVVYRNLIGSESVLITDRAPSGTAVVELESVATKDWKAAIKAGTLGALNLVHGSVAGYIVEVDAPNVRISDETYSDSDGIAMSNLALDLQPDTGNDELVLTFR
jgi:hypothetical protein